LQIDALENSLLQVAVSPFLKQIISLIDRECPDKYICGGCRARAHSYFDGDVKMPDVGCIHNEPLWEKMVDSRK
jgi:MoaA/NifB/PqqE/SkfB family radical SAM enzyme